MNRIRAGFCEVPNPFNPKQVSRVSLKPEDVTIFVFWTRNPRPLMEYLPELDSRGFKYYFLYTIIGYPKELEASPPREEAIKCFRELSRNIGREKVIWRYDPLILSNLTTIEWHKENFMFIADRLKGFTERVITSVIEPYRKTKSRLEKETGEGFTLLPGAFDEESYIPLFEFIGKNSVEFGITPFSCSEDIELDEFGIKHGICIDADLISSIIKGPLKYRKDPSQRKMCRCTVSKDIGMNTTCLFNCRYCYATSSLDQARKNRQRHEKNSDSLIRRDPA
jgi:hypothetical protein